MSSFAPDWAEWRTANSEPVLWNKRPINFDLYGRFRRVPTVIMKSITWPSGNSTPRPSIASLPMGAVDVTPHFKRTVQPRAGRPLEKYKWTFCQSPSQDVLHQVLMQLSHNRDIQLWQPRATALNFQLLSFRQAFHREYCTPLWPMMVDASCHLVSLIRIKTTAYQAKYG